MNFKAKLIKMPGKRQRADAYRGLTYLQLNTDKGTQQIIRLAHQKVVCEVKTS